MRCNGANPNQTDREEKTEMALEQELGQLINILNPYSNPTGAAGYPNPMEFRTNMPPAGPGQVTAQFEVEIDNYEGEWSFKGVTNKVSRALRITYRYPRVDANNNPNGVWATEHLLIGYAGGNGA